MKHIGPKADAELRPYGRPFVSEIDKFRKLSVSLGLTGLANNTKWNELLTEMRNPERAFSLPSYRCSYIDSDYVSDWDVEWMHHLPYPLSCISWMELTYKTYTHRGHLLPDEVCDHSVELESLLNKIGFDFEKGEDVIRIYAYAPRNRNGFKI